MIIPVKLAGTGVCAGAKGQGDSAVAGSVVDGKQPQDSKTDRTSKLELPQWSMVEFQGELLSKDKLSGQAIGKMTIDNGKPSLVIGNHKLEGKVVSEPKPLLVLRKVFLPDDDDDHRGDGGDGMIAGGSKGGSGGEDAAQHAQRIRRREQKQDRVQYQIVGKITNKTIFKTRPKPLIRKGGASISSALSAQSKKA